MYKQQIEIPTISQAEKVNLSTTEISRKIKEQLKRDFKNCVFSVSSKYYSGGSSISIYLMKADFKIIKEPSEITETAFFNYEQRQRYTREQLIKNQTETHFQLNQFTLREAFNNDNWNNGVFLTEQGHKLLSDVVKIADAYNWNNSDSSIDYFDVNFSFNIDIGKWDKPFIQEVKR